MCQDGQLQHGAESFAKWQKDLVGLHAAIKKDADTRIRLNSHLRDFIERIEIFSKGHEDSVEHVEALVDEYFEAITRADFQAIMRAESYKSFRKYARQRLLSNEGRMFRVHYKTAKAFTGMFAAADAGIQVAPAYSLANRVEVRGRSGNTKCLRWRCCWVTSTMGASRALFRSAVWSKEPH